MKRVLLEDPRITSPVQTPGKGGTRVESDRFVVPIVTAPVQRCTPAAPCTLPLNWVFLRPMKVTTDRVSVNGGRGSSVRCSFSEVREASSCLTLLDQRTSRLPTLVASRAAVSQGDDVGVVRVADNQSAGTAFESSWPKTT
jgi:hypothetical protein